MYIEGMEKSGLVLKIFSQKDHTSISFLLSCLCYHTNIGY